MGWSDPTYGILMPDGTPDTRWQTAPLRVGHRVNDALIDGAIGVVEGGRKLRDTYNAAEGWLDDRYEDVVDFFDRDRYASSGPLARHGYRRHRGGYAIPANASLTPEAQAYRDRAAFGNPHVLSYDFATQEAYDKAVRDAQEDIREYNMGPFNSKTIWSNYI